MLFRALMTCALDDSSLPHGVEATVEVDIDTRVRAHHALHVPTKLRDSLSLGDLHDNIS